MSKNYKKLRKQLLSKKNKVFFAGKKSSNLISQIENLLSINFCGDYLDFVSEFGAGSVNGLEIYGVIHSDMDNASIPNAAWITLQIRSEIKKFPKGLLIISDDGMGNWYCLDFSKVKDNEPRLVLYKLDDSIEELSYTFSEFILKNI